MVEFFLGTFAIAGRAPALAQMAEQAGWDGLALSDSQNLHGTRLRRWRWLRTPRAACA